MCAMSENSKSILPVYRADFQLIDINPKPFEENSLAIIQSQRACQSSEAKSEAETWCKLVQSWW